MKRFFLNISVFILSLILLSSCNDEQDEQMQSALDSLKSALDTVSHEDTLTSDSSFNEVLIDYSKKYNAITDFSTIKKSSPSHSAGNLKSKYFLFPVFSYQIDYISQDSSTDTVLTYFTDNSVSFVFDVDRGIGKIKNLDKQKNGLILVKSSKVEVSQKLYLMKRSRDFQHKERKVTEFFVSCEVIDAFNVNSSEKILQKKFKLIK
ncbi:MAG: hypothetical protein WC644_08140 [Ignavibacteria bacterium]